MIDTMIEILTNDAIGLPAVQLAGEVIAADAAFNIRMAAAHGRTGHSTADRMMGRINAYAVEIANAQAAWRSFGEAVARIGAFSAGPHEELERALRAIRETLDKLAAE